MNPEQKSSPTGCTGCPQAPKWRSDFPIEWEGDHYVSRREMVKFLTLGSLLLTSASWITVVTGHLRRSRAYPEQIIGSASALDQQRSFLFRYPTDKDPCIAVRTPEGKLVAYSQVCTHLSCAVIYDQSDNQLFCPCHHGSFNILQGEPIGGPPTRRLPRILIEQRGDQLFATGVEV